MDFRMKLDRPHFFRWILNPGESVGRASHERKPLGKLFRFVTVRHPDGKHFGKTFEKLRVRDFFYGRMAIFALRAGAHFYAQSMHHEVEAIADAEHRLSHGEHAGVRLWSVGIVNRRRPSRQNDSDGRIRIDLLEGCRAW